jgi:hypothetical protein
VGAVKIEIPVAAYHEYNTAIYVEKAFNAMGHEAKVITQAEYYEDRPDVDLFFCVDSAGPLRFPEKHQSRSTMWFIDSRHNNDPRRRQPDDDTNALNLAAGGGWVFQAQREDWLRNRNLGVSRSSWLPLAADPDIWKPNGSVTKTADIGFGGNIWCEQRRELLERIKRQWRLSHFTGTPDVLAKAYARCHIGFNVSGWYGTPVAYDINMRVFEIMACGLPLVTNRLSELDELGMVSDHHLLAYDSVEGALASIKLVLERGPDYRNTMGLNARHLILQRHTYRHRIEQMLEILKGVL